MDSAKTRDHRPANVKPTPLSCDVEDLLCSWEEAQDAGRDLSPEDLCRDYPELLETLRQRIEVLQAMRRFLGVMDVLPGPASITPTDAALSPGGEAPVILGEGPPGYDILSVLGRGGMGIVYRARQVGLERVVALKMILTQQYAGTDDIARFCTEAGAVAKLRHPSIVQIFDIGEHRGLPYFSFEYCEGGSLDKWLSGNLAPPTHAAAIIATLARAIQHVHDRGIIHRDLKPANILVNQDRPDAFGPQSIDRLDPVALKITDFGLARQLNSPGLTQSGAVLGTPSYMAPEQAAGLTTELGPPVDIYALGAVLYELLTGRPPFRSATMLDTLESVRNSDPVRPRRLNSHIPADLETICLKCLNKEPSRRYASAGELADDLQRFLSNEPIAARSAGRCERFLRWCRRNPRVAALAGSIAILLVVIAVGSVLAAAWWKEESDAARKAEEKAVQSDNRLRQELFRVYLAESSASRKSGKVGQRENGLNAMRQILAALPVNELSDEQRGILRDEAIACLALVDVREQKRLPISSELFFDTAIDDALEVFFGWSSSGLSAVTLRNGEIRRQLIENHELRPGDRALRRLSPDCRWLVEVVIGAPWAPNHRIRVLDCQTLKWVADVASVGTLAPPTIHPKDPLMFISCGDAVLRVVELPSCFERRRSPARFPGARIALSPDGKAAAVALSNGTSEIIDTATWETLETIPEVQRATAVAWSEKGDFVVFGSEDGSLYIWSTSNKRGRQLGVRHAMAVDDVIVSPDGDYLASTGLDNVAHLRKARGDRLLFSITGRAIRFSRDGRRLALADGQGISIQEIIDEQSYKVESTPIEGVEFSPDGRWLAVGGPYGARLLSASNLLEVASFDLDPCGPPSFRPDGGEVVTFGLFTHAWRWPMTRKQNDATTWEIGPARPFEETWLSALSRNLLVEPHRRGRHSGWSRDGRFLAVADYRAHTVRLLDRENKNAVPREFGKLVNASRIAVNPDGNWVAAAASLYLRAKVWKRSGAVEVLDLPNHGHVAFSDDNQWFASSSAEAVQLFRVGSWEAGPRLPRDEVRAPYAAEVPVAFQRHGVLVAYAFRRGVIRLCDRDTGAVVANLQDPQNRMIGWLSFSPDGARLAFAGVDWDVGIWDLHALRSGLLTVGLDVAALPNQPGSVDLGNEKLTVIRGTQLPSADRWSENWLRLAKFDADFGRYVGATNYVTEGLHLLRLDATPQERADLYTARGRYHLLNQNRYGARADWERALALVPLHPQAARHAIRLTLLSPPAHLDPARAYGLLTSMTDGDHPDSELLVLLSLAQARLGRTKNALVVLKRVESDGPQPLLSLTRTFVYKKLGMLEESASEFSRADKAFQALPTVRPGQNDLQSLYDEVRTMMTKKN